MIIPHYDMSISDAVFKRGMDSLLAQKFQDFEIILLHDGPLSRPLPIDSYRHRINDVIVTDKRFGDWGHSLRDMGMRIASGEYVVHFNPDNVLYENAFAEIDYAIINRVVVDLPPEYRGDDGIYVFTILMRGMQTNGKIAWRDLSNMGRFIILTGYPCIKNNIDCMQLVMKRELWLAYGGWYDKSQESDGYMYPRFISEHGATYIFNVLGEHW